MECALILRGASHTLATCHVATHAEGSALYVLAFLKYQNQNKENLIKTLEKERKEQIDHLVELKEKYEN